MKTIHTAYSKNAPGHYVPGILTGNTLYISGQLPRDPKTQCIPESFEAQVKQALANIHSILLSAGIDKKNVVMCRAYLPDVGYWDDFNMIYAEWFGEHKPARVVVPTRALHYGALVEIEAIAEMEE